jgi:hypothetical protein
MPFSFRHALQLATGERLERGADLRADVARADGEAEDLAEDLLDLVSGTQVVHGRDDHGRHPSVPRQKLGATSDEWIGDRGKDARCRLCRWQSQIEDAAHGGRDAVGVVPNL